MGKRELLLIAGFLIVGVVVYQATAPPPAPGERSFSFRRIFDNVRREISANRASAEATTRTTYPAGPDLKELRLNLRTGNITIAGEDRSDIEAELQVRSSGYDEAEAERLAKATVLKADRAGDSLNCTVSYPAEGRQRAGTVVLRIPSRLRVRLDPTSGELTISNVAELELAGARGETRITGVAGRIIATQTGGSAAIVGAGSLKLTARGTDVEVNKVTGEASLNLRSGELKLGEVVGPIDIESNSTELTLERLANTTGTLRINAVNGKVAIQGLRSDGRIDTRNAEVDLQVDRAAPLAVYADGEPVQITPPAGGYQLDAVASEGRITLPEGTLDVTTSGQQQRASGPVRGGGATITIRTTRGDITVRPR